MCPSVLSASLTVSHSDVSSLLSRSTSKAATVHTSSCVLDVAGACSWYGLWATFPEAKHVHARTMLALRVARLRVISARRAHVACIPDLMQQHYTYLRTLVLLVTAPMSRATLTRVGPLRDED